jgi:hypothetical protein
MQWSVIFARAVLAIGATVLAAGADGCWMGAAQLAPLGLEVASTVGSGVIKTAAGSHGDATEDDIDREERCDDLQLEAPGLIELRTDKIGAPQWRELRLGGSTDEPRWEVATGKDTAAGGWLPAQNLSTMNFAPSLQSSLKPDAENYVAYAPADPKTSTEQDQLVALTVDFGAATGIFRWNGRTYQYSVVRKLPCFPPPIAMR